MRKKIITDILQNVESPEVFHLGFALLLYSQKDGRADALSIFPDEEELKVHIKK